MSLYLNGKKVDNIDKAIVSEDGWIGIGAALERIVFDGSGNDISVLGANLGVGVSDPGYTTEIGAVAGSDATFALSDGDIAHGMTTLAQTDVFAHAGPISSAAGGVRITGLTDADVQALEIRGVIGVTDPTDTTSAVKITGAKKSGTGIQDLAATETVLKVVNNDDVAAITVLGSGNVGIGTTGPGAKLHVSGANSTIRLADTNTGNSGTGYLAFYAGSTRIGYVGDASSGDSDIYLHGEGGKLRLGDSSGNSVMVLNTGNVGIGTTSPGGLLALKGTLSSALTGTVSVTINTATVTGVGTAFTTELAVGDSIKIGSEVFTVSAIASATSLTLNSNHLAGASGATAYRDPTLLAIDNGDAVNKLTITRSGNVGIGTTGPSDKLHITGTTAGAGNANTAIYLEQPADTVGSRVRLVSGVTGGTPYFAIEARHGTTPWDIRERLRIDNQGNVGIGTTEPFDLLTVLATSTVGSETLTETAFTTHANWDVTGDFVDSGGNATYTHSAGSGTLTQQSANFAIPVKPGRYYKFSYTVSGVTAGCTANITTAIASTTTALTLTNGAQTTYFKSAAAPGNFVISATSTAGGFILDDVTLKEIQGGAGNFGGGLTALTGTFEASDNGTAITARINAAQASVDAGDTFIDFRSTTGSEGTIAGTAVPAIVPS